MAKVVLSGYYGFDNIGDEAILYSIITALRQDDATWEIMVLSHNPARTTALYGVQAVNRWQYREVKAALQNADLLISGGGSLLQDVTGIKSLAYYLGVITLARFLGKPVFFYAQGIGPVKSFLGRSLMSLIVNRVQEITVRDVQSQGDLVAMGIVNPPITVTADPVLGLTVGEEERALGKKLLAELKLSAEKPVLGVSVRPWAESEAMQDALATGCDALVQMGWQVLFLPLHWPADQKACQEVQAKMQEASICLAKNHTVPEMLALVSGCQMIVGMRLHSVIMAAAAEVPLVGISYDPKIDRFLQQVNLMSACTIGGGNCLPATMTYTAENLAVAREALVSQMKPLRQSAAATVHCLKRCLYRP